MTDICQNITNLKNEIQALSPTRPVKLVAVSKTQSLVAIQQALQTPHQIFGENYAQEFDQKFSTLINQNIEWHFIGHLQSNKAKLVVGRAALIHTLDRLSLADEIQKISERLNHIQDVLIEVKISPDAHKSGVPLEDLDKLLTQLKDYQNIRVRGLMTMASFTPDRNQIQKEFRLLRERLCSCNQNKLYKETLTELSMGMSQDFDLAIQEGATLIRVGSKLFGERI